MLCLAILRIGVEYADSEIPTVINAWRHAGVMASMPPAEFRSLRGGTEVNSLVASMLAYRSSFGPYSTKLHGRR